MDYFNLHNITSKKQDIQQTGVQFAGTLKAGYNLSYAYANNPQQISNIADTSCRTESAIVKTAKLQNYSYDANGNLLCVITGTKNIDGSLIKNNERKLLWDEENRLLALSDNGFVSNYWYDAAGERTVKESGDGQGVSVNGVLSAGRTGTTNFTAYISPYTVIGNGGQMSKHIYIGSQRIISKLMNGGTMADPTQAPKVASVDYTVKYADLVNKMKVRYDSLGVAYRGTDNRSSFYKQVSSPDSENQQYFFHSDHLGSSSLVTDLSGNVAQHIEYVPFGEVFVEERNNSWSTPFKFNAKELDEETGLYYYGARYYNPRSSVWLSVDPLAEKYPNVSSYVYCLGNPLKYIDPDGRVLFLVNGWDGLSKKTKYASNSSDFVQMRSYWINQNPQFINQVGSRFNEKRAYLVDGSQGGASHGSVAVRHDNGYAYAKQLIKDGTVDFSEPINIVAHSMGGAFSSGMVDAFLEANPKAIINLLLLAPDGAEKFSVDKRTNAAQFTFGDDGIVTSNTAVVGNVDVNLNPNNTEYTPWENGMIDGKNAHGAQIDDPAEARRILNNKRLDLFIIKPQNNNQKNGNQNTTTH